MTRKLSAKGLAGQDLGSKQRLVCSDKTLPICVEIFQHTVNIKHIWSSQICRTKREQVRVAHAKPETLTWFSERSWVIVDMKAQELTRFHRLYFTIYNCGILVRHTEIRTCKSVAIFDGSQITRRQEISNSTSILIFPPILLAGFGIAVSKVLLYRSPKHDALASRSPPC